MKKLKWFQVHPYPVHYCLVTTVEILEKTCKKFGAQPPRDLDNIWGAVWDGGKYQIVWINPTSTPENTANTIVHESVHVLQHAIKYAEEDQLGKEFEAYATADICSNLFAEFTKQQEARFALYAKRKTGLCEGEQAVQLPPGTNQESLGTDSGTSGIECSWTDTQG